MREEKEEKREKETQCLEQENVAFNLYMFLRYGFVGFVMISVR